MTDEPGDSRRELLARTVRTYRKYETSGRSRRWAKSSSGTAIGVDERDHWLSSVLANDVDGTIVDLGCGSGALAVLLNARGLRPNRLLGIDLMEERLVAARAAAPWADFVKGSADEIPLADAAASAVVAMTLLSSITEPWFRKRVANEVGRVLRPGGRFVVYDIRYPSPGNPNVRPVSAREIRAAFPNWDVSTRTLTLLPPLARRAVGGGGLRYRLLTRLPILRSHIGIVAIKPGRLEGSRPVGAQATGKGPSG